MSFLKRRKNPSLYRGANPDPTAAEKAAGQRGRVPHPNPDPTAEEKRIAAGVQRPAAVWRDSTPKVPKAKRAKAKKVAK
jgi:hypothetical protein